MLRVQDAFASALRPLRRECARRRAYARALALGCAAMASVASLAGCPSAAPVRIGIVMDTSAIAAAELAAADINAAGGLNGHPLELRTIAEPYTLQGLPAMKTAEQLAADPAILAVVGHSNSAASLAASEVYNAHHLVQIAPNSTTELFRDAGPYSFRLVSGDDQQAAFLASLARRLGHPRVALLFVNDDYGRPLSMSLRTDLARAGIPIVYEAPHVQTDNSDDTPTLAGLERTHPDVLLWIGRPDRLARMRPGLDRVLPRVLIIGSDGMEGTIVQQERDGPFTGIEYVALLDPSERDPALTTLRARYRAATHTELTDGAAYTYDAVMLLANAVRAGARTREDVRRYLESLGTKRPPYAGATGAIAFDAKGDVPSRYFLVRVTEDGRVPVDTARFGR
ncbi:MAG TPA: branched-chain amino acid ABC transporter substrate-binding protein [Gemmatimonadaceae bacterium]|nr:branched-chain amino acid ABC transporter substrate-binding protein [Gemmatimonadaceae bacterium]